MDESLRWPTPAEPGGSIATVSPNGPSTPPRDAAPSDGATPTPRVAVVVALVANLTVAAAKFGAFAITSSSALLAEALHSLADSANEILLLVGARRARRPADRRHPFGYGHELYFWTLVVGILIFALGGGMSIVTGVLHIRSGAAPEASGWNYAVIFAAMAL